MKFDPQELEKLSQNLEGAEDEIEQTVVFWDFLNKKLKETQGSSEGLKDLSSGVKLLEGHFKSMGISARKVMKEVNRSLTSREGPPRQNPLVEQLKAIQKDAEKYLPEFSGRAISKLKGRLSEVLGKDLKIDTQGLKSLDKLPRSSKDELQRLVALSGFFKEKIKVESKGHTHRDKTIEKIVTVDKILYRDKVKTVRIPYIPKWVWALLIFNVIYFSCIYKKLIFRF